MLGVEEGEFELQVWLHDGLGKVIWVCFGPEDTCSPEVVFSLEDAAKEVLSDILNLILKGIAESLLQSGSA